jgi:hypothetical protein
LGCYFPPPEHQFAPQEYPIAVAKARNKHLNLAQVEEHVFQNFDMLSKSYLLQGEPFNEIYNTK